MKKFLNRERIIALICLFFGVILWVAACNLPQAKQDPIGPTIFPKFLAIIIIVTSVIHFIISTGPYEAKATDKNYLDLLYLVVCVSVYLLIMKPVGFFISTIPFLLALTLHFDTRPIKEKIIPSVGFSVVFTVLLYLVFAKALSVLLPTLFL